MTPQLREAIFQFEYNSKLHKFKPEDCVPLQLQRLFANLQLIKTQHTNTKALTTSFDWNSDYDLVELALILFENLEDTR